MLKIVFFVVLFAHVKSLTILDENIELKNDAIHSYNKHIKFIDSYPTKPDETRCSYIETNRFKIEYIIEINPVSDMKIAHHMTLTGCEFIPDFNESIIIGNTWQCDTAGAPICGFPTDLAVSRRIFTWALNADGLKFPKGVGYRIGGSTRINYLVMQVHYKDKLAPNVTDSLSNYNLVITNHSLPYQVGVYTLGNDGIIPPRMKDFQFDSGCQFDLHYDIVPIYYRVHTHGLGSVVSGYLVRNNTWKELGRNSPQQKQQFYSVTNKGVVIKRDDFLVSKCTFDTMSKNESTITGQMHQDEMCVFYLMFYTDFARNIYDDFYCYNDGNSFNITKDLGLITSFPSDAADLSGVKLLEIVKHHTH